MRRSLDLLRREPRARRFFLAHAQSSLGTGAAYVVLLVVAYERFRSPWAIALVLLAEFLPGMALGPLLGAAADRWSRRNCAVVADVARALAFVALGFVDGFWATIACALVAGAGNALYRPAVLAALPGLVARERAPAATALFGMLSDIGHTAGPALAALALLLAGGETVLALNGLTFALSALLLARLSFGAAPERGTGGSEKASLARSAADGLRLAAARAGVRTVILSSSAVILFAGLFNVGELLLARNELGAGGSGYSILVAVYGASVALGSLTGSRGGNPQHLARRYLQGLLLVAVGMLLSGLAPVLWVALATFALAGFGNGLVLVHERLLLQATVPDALMARVFGLKETLMSWAFCISFVAGGALATLLGTRPLFLLAGGGALVVWAWASLVLRQAIAAPAAPHGETAGTLAEPSARLGTAQATGSSAGRSRPKMTARSASAGVGSGSMLPRVTTRSSADTTHGSNWVPEFERSSSSASSTGIASR